MWALVEFMFGFLAITIIIGLMILVAAIIILMCYATKRLIEYGSEDEVKK